MYARRNSKLAFEKSSGRGQIGLMKFSGASQEVLKDCEALKILGLDEDQEFLMGGASRSRRPRTAETQTGNCERHKERQERA